MAGIKAPENYNIRDPRDKMQMNGRNANPPRYMEAGGAKGPGIWAKPPMDSQGPEEAIAKLERGGPGVAVGRRSTRKNLD